MSTSKYRRILMEEVTWLTSKEAAGYLKVSDQTLRKWRMQKRHIKFTKDRGKIKYKLEDIIRFISGSTYEVTPESTYKR